MIENKIIPALIASLKKATDKDGNVIIHNGVELLHITASQILDCIKALEDEYYVEGKHSKEECFNSILIKLNNLFITRDLKYSGVFPCINFSNCIFDGDLVFEDTVFAGEFILSNIEFYGNVKFHNIKFIHESPKYFSNSKFYGSYIEFINIEMIFGDKVKNEMEIDANGYIVIHQCLFNIFFREAEFGINSSAVFENIICNEINFEGAKFNGYNADFDKLTCQLANFESILINDQSTLSIDNSKIMNRLNFSNISSPCNIYFNGIKLKTVDFSNSKFKYFQFYNVEVKGIAHFNEVEFTEDVDFSKNIILSQADFSDATFKKKANFATCIFNTAPLFHETTLHQDTSFEGAQFLRCETDEDYRAYRTLKQHMNDVHATLEESKFFALEQRTRRYLDAQDMRKNWLTVAVSYLYDTISGYGQDLLKPVLWLVCTWYVFAGVFSLSGMVGVSDKLKGTWFESIFPGFGYSTQNIFNPLSAINFLNIDRAFYPYNPWIAFLGWLEALFSVAFITLWLLAVRRRFQKGE